MRRILLLAAFLTVALPTAAHASVIPTVSAGTLTVTGDGAADSITLRLTSPTTLDVNGFVFERTTFSKISIRSGAGDDNIRIAGALTESVTIESAGGADTVVGGAGKETIVAGDDVDLVHPGGGDDTVFLGAGDDTAIQTGDDAFDRIEGQQGIDTLDVLGTSESEEFTLQSLGNRARITRDTSPALAELAAVEIADVRAGGGPDLVDIGNLAGSGLQRVDADLGVGDGARDQVAAQGGPTNDFISASASNDAAVVFGLAGGVFLRVDNASAADDRLTLFGGDGRDSIQATVSVIGVAVDGGAGPDQIIGSEAADNLRGGPGVDLVIGRKGADAIDLGDGDDFALWNDGDGNDTLEASTGNDTLTVRGSGVGESVTAAPNGARVRVTRNVGAVALDVDDFERLDVELLAGTDRLTVGDLAGTDLKAIDADVGVGDNATDEVTVSGTPARDTITVGGGTVSGLAAQVTVAPAEPRDILSLNGLGEADSIDSTGVPVNGIRIHADGGLGDDVVLGGPGDDISLGGGGADVLFAGSGDNVAFGGAGDDVLRGEEGDDVLDGGADNDVLIGNAGDDVLLNGEVVFDD